MTIIRASYFLKPCWGHLCSEEGAGEESVPPLQWDGTARLGRQEPERVREPARLFGSHVRSSSSWQHLVALVLLGKHKSPSEGCSWAPTPGRGPLASHPRSLWEGEGLRGSDCCSAGSGTRIWPAGSPSLPPVHVEKEKWILAIKLHRSHNTAKEEKAVLWISIAHHFSGSEAIYLSAE